MSFVWLASYPKSGNTWMRLMVQSLAQGGGPVDLSRPLAPGLPLRSRDTLGRLLGADCGELSAEEIERLRPWTYIKAAGLLPGPSFHKTHERWRRTAWNEPILPPEASCGAVYILRDPRDIALSLAHHTAVTLDAAIAVMADADHTLAEAGDRYSLLYRQPLGTWSQHVLSWVENATPVPLILRYEDMIDDPLAALTGVCAHIGLNASAAVLRAATRSCAFDVLRRAEQDHGFTEAMPGRAFFRRGLAGGWRDTLSPAQRQRIEDDHRAVMSRFGYLPPSR
ncbi:sulfotransferase [Rhodospirillum rubrum]|uniref:sulfotransferase domain-containing protein n=1 Tax=Rhodospirillum rubrum TaxID=1085 RepID=UPI001904B43F|nr:sulfotransferase domain-containing protein [Rhodospirillum rubrum]MBK1663201.1 sulfotransferase [Rhodospirillum rubrum]MBK1677004.1 sulfotransferase [Rhodospirillum rubrum]